MFELQRPLQPVQCGGADATFHAATSAILLAGALHHYPAGRRAPA